VTALLEARGLGRWYGPVIGLNALDLELRGGVVGLLGPNGAGKSTLLKLIAGELRPSRGGLRVLGEAPFANRAYLRKLGFAPQQDALYGDLTGLATVELLVRLHGFSAREARARAERALARVGLADAAGRRTRGYSKGMRQRVRIAQAFAHSPELLVLDEPLTGLDPLGRREMLDLFAEVAREGAHVILSSHVLHEVEELTSYVVLLHRGRLLAQGEVGEIRRLLSRHPRKIEIRARDARRLGRALLAQADVAAVRLAEDGRGLSLETRDVDGFFARLPAIADAERAGILALESPDAGLEAVFDYLVGGT
jgi:ABC-2 type transport system ATP-binding protein